MLLSEFENPADDHDISVKSKHDLTWLYLHEAPEIRDESRPLWFACVNHAKPMIGDLTPTGDCMLLVMKYEHAPGSNFRVKGRYRSCDLCPKSARFILEVLRSKLSVG